MSNLESARTFPRFSQAEMQRRSAAVRDVMASAGLDALVLFANRATPNEVLFLTNFQVGHEAALIFPAVGEPVLFVSYFNHLPNALRLSAIQDVRWLGDDAIATVGAELKSRKLERSALGVSGALTPGRHHALLQLLDPARMVDVGPRFSQLRLVKSAEELDLLRRAAELSDRAQAALESEARIGMSEHELVDLVERAYVPLGGSTHIHFIGTTAMESPDLCCPAQTPSGRRLTAGDVVITELSAQLHGYFGQILRTASVGAPATAAYERMHEVARKAFEAVTGVLREGTMAADVLDAADLIAESGYTICDDLLHFAVGAYSPHLRTRQTMASEPRFVFRKNMVVVVQPNVCTTDLRSGVQVGQMVRITEVGVEQLHRLPMALNRIA